MLLTEVRYVLVYTETNVFCILHLVIDIVCEHWRESVHIRTYILYIFRSILISWFSCFVYLDRSKLKSDSHSVYVHTYILYMVSTLSYTFE